MVSLIMGIIPIMGGILGIAFGIAALRRIRRTHEQGRNMAITGIVLGTAWFLVLGVAGVLSVLGEADRGVDGSVDAGGSVKAIDLRLGDCPASTTPGGEILTVQLVPCRQPHRAEVYAEFVLSGRDFPGKDEVVRLGAGGCADHLITLVGVARAKAFAVEYAIPSAEAWDLNHHTVACMVVGPAGQMLPGGSAFTR